MELFKKALCKMQEDGEFEKVIKNAKRSEKKNIKQIQDIVKNYRTEQFSGIPVLMSIESASLLKNVICYMIMLNAENEQK